MTRNGGYTLGFIVACVVYVVVNYLSLKTRYIPSEGQLLAWGLVIPLLVAPIGVALSIAILKTIKARVCGVLAACAFCFLIGWLNNWLIHGIWATI